MEHGGYVERGLYGAQRLTGVNRRAIAVNAQPRRCIARAARYQFPGVPRFQKAYLQPDWPRLEPSS